MNQAERRQFLIQELLKENPAWRDVHIPADAGEQRELLRGLLNVRPAKPCGETFLKVQDAYLGEETMKKGITELADLKPVEDGIYLWQGDITTLRVDAIVNAANTAFSLLVV